MENTARGILKIDNKYVFIKRTNKPGCKYDCFYAIPGGHLEKGEDFEEACLRELEEELGIKVKINKLFYEESNDEVNKFEKYYLVDYISGELGTGKGEEFDKNYHNQHGTYQVVCIDSDKLQEYTILPDVIKQMLIQKERK